MRSENVWEVATSPEGREMGSTPDERLGILRRVEEEGTSFW
jgi:hypothetical protein